MQMTAIQPTPNPNSMKINFDDQLGITGTFDQNNKDGLDNPKLKSLLEIEGVQSLFVTANFATINRDPASDWDAILKTAEQVLQN